MSVPLHVRVMFVQGIVPDVKLSIPDLGKLELPTGATVDLRGVDKAAEKALNTSAALTVDLVIALLFVAVGWLISRWVATQTQRALMRAKVEETAAAFLGSAARYSLLLGFMVIALQILGVSRTTTVALVGASGLAIAFALRNTVSHLASGIMLIVTRPFKVGDWIEIGAIQGTVKRITMFNTEINTLSHQRVYIPNTAIWENNLINHTYNETRIVELRIVLPFHDAPDTCKTIMRDALMKNTKVLRRPAPFVGTEKMTDHGIGYEIRVAVRTMDYDLVRYALLDTLLDALAAEGIAPEAFGKAVAVAHPHRPQRPLRKKPH
jgi:small conductance mechanosensitive channel